MSGAALKRVLSRAQMRLAGRSDACEGPGWARTEHMQKESGYVVGVPKMHRKVTESVTVVVTVVLVP